MGLLGSIEVARLRVGRYRRGGLRVIVSLLRAFRHVRSRPICQFVCTSTLLSVLGISSLRVSDPCAGQGSLAVLSC